MAEEIITNVSNEVVTDNQPIEQAAETPSNVQEREIVTKDEGDYTKDPRWGKIWKTDKDIYKSYRELDKGFGQYNGTLKKLGIKSPAELESRYNQVSEYEKQMEELKNSGQEHQKVYNYLNHILSNPRYAGKIQPILDEVNKQIRLDWVREQVGNPQLGELPPELLDTVASLLEKDQKREQEVAEQKANQVKEQNLKLIDTQIGNIKDFAQKTGLEFGDAEEKEFLEWFSQQKNDDGSLKYPLHTMKALYLELAMEQGLITKNAQLQGEKKVIENLQKNQGNKKPTNTKPAAPAQPSKKDKYLQIARSMIGE